MLVLGPNIVPELPPKKDGSDGSEYWERLPDGFSNDKLFTEEIIKDGEKTINKILRFSSFFNWRLVNLEEAFRNVMGEPTRTLHIYSNVGGSTIVGNQKTDLLREVTYKREGRGTVYYEPLHKHYHSVRSRTIEIAEINVAETNGTLVSFPDDGRAQTFVTLHFRRIRRPV